MSSSYHIEQKTFIEVSYTNNIYSGKKVVAAATFEVLWAVSFQRGYKKNVIHFGMYVRLYIPREEKTTQILFM